MCIREFDRDMLDLYSLYMELPRPTEWVLHCCWLLALLPPGNALAGARLAEFHGVPEEYLVKQLKLLVRAGVLAASTGPRGGYRLGRDPGSISIGEVVGALDGERPLFRCEEIRRRGPCAASANECRRACGIAAVMDRAEQAWRAELDATMLSSLGLDTPSAATSRARKWLVGMGIA